ncbi:MAG TPA: LytTR family DNA-binding domain-containing protein [Flavobacteriales bacterium]|jgi:two-component system LytT family response regulator|nr:LytTR family DNA-binding domain-containing protein [Flavobacteriales bacterium]
MSDSPYRCVVIDDEAASRDVLAAYISKYCPELELTGKAENAETGIALIDRTAPHLVFLDIEMPFRSGFDLLATYGDLPFEVVFVTAYGDHALQAIHVSAADYLLKPVSIEQLQAAVHKVVQRLNDRQRVQHARILLENLRAGRSGDQKVVLPLLDGFEVVSPKDIVRCEAEDNFTRFLLSNGERRLICRPLKHYEDALVPLGFVRVHRSHVVNIASIRRYRKGKGGSVVLLDGTEVPVSEAYRPALMEVFK